jgi:hypothetical protein
MVLGSGIRDPGKTYSGSRIQGSKRHRIPDPDPQHGKKYCLAIHETNTDPDPDPVGSGRQALDADPVPPK